MDLSGRFARTIQENLIVLLCFDDIYGKVVRNLVDSELFDPFYQEVVVRASSFIDSYNSAPGNHTADLFDDILEGTDKHKAEIFKTILRNLYENKDKVDPKFTIDKAKNFVSLQYLKKGILEAADFLQRDDPNSLDEAKSTILKYLDVSNESFDGGIGLSDDNDALRFLTSDKLTVLPCGIKEFERGGIGPIRGGLYLFMALPKSGKTWQMVHLGKIAMVHRLKVCHITLEMSEDEISERWHQAMFSLPRRDVISNISRFKIDQFGKFEDLLDDSLKSKISLSDAKAFSFLKSKREKLKRIMKNVIIKQFPTGSLTIPKLKGYLDQLESSRGFVPDLLLVDYADIMDVNPKNYRRDLGKIYEDLRGIAVDRNFAVVTASQANREALSAQKITEKNIAEDFSKIATADTIISYNQTEPERKLGLARLYVVATRREQSKTTVLISQDYSKGQFVLESCFLSGEYWDVVNDS